MMLTCDAIAILGGAFALDLLPPEEAEAVTVHVAGCVACGERTRARLQTGEWLAHLEAPEPLPDGLRRRLHLRLQEATGSRPRDAAPFAPVAGPVPLPAQRPWRWGIVAVMAVALVALVAWNLGLQRDQRSLERAQQLAGEAQEHLLAHLNRQRAIQALAPERAPRLARLQGGRHYPAASGTLAWLPENGRWTLTAHGLPVLQPGQVFQLWAGNGERPTPVVACRTAAAVLAVPVPAHGALRAGAPLLVTVETGAARQRPTGELVLLGLLAD